MMLLIVIVSAIFVYFDAKQIGVHKGLVDGFFDMGVGAWTTVTLLFWIIGFPAYLVKRGSLKEASARERAVNDSAAAAVSSSGISSFNIASLEKLADLRDRGVLTTEEFEKKKKELLG
jgi:Short C-terminal domain